MSLEEKSVAFSLSPDIYVKPYVYENASLHLERFEPVFSQRSSNASNKNQLELSNVLLAQAVVAVKTCYRSPSTDKGRDSLSAILAPAPPSAPGFFPSRFRAGCWVWWWGRRAASPLQ